MSIVMEEPPKPRTFTPDDLLHMPDEGMGFELVHGELRELNVSFLSAYVAGNVLQSLGNHVRPKNLGWVSGEGVSYRCFPDNPAEIRRPDAAFHRLERLTPGQALARGHCTVVPDLVVEVVSPNDLSYEVDEKRNEWLDAGAALVWIVQPVQQTIHAYRSPTSVRLFGPNDTLTAEPVLPEFQVPVADLFKLPTAQPA